jgi:phage I-like protein
MTTPAPNAALRGAAPKKPQTLKGIVHGDAVALSDESAAATPDAPVWIQIAKQGKFLGHSAGPFELNETIFKEIIANFKAHPEHLPIDFEHASEAAATDGSIPTHGAPAHGWIQDMKIVSPDLFGLVAWTPLARDYIKNGNYRHFSPAVRLGAKDRVTGKPIGARMTSGALTNSPFLAGMQRVAAKHTEAGDEAEIAEDLDEIDDDNDTRTSASAEANQPPEGEIEMDAKALKDAEDKIVVLGDRFQLTDAKLKDTEKLVTAKDAEIVILQTERTTLLAWKAEREEADLTARVEKASRDYPKEWPATKQVHMKDLIKAAPAAFEASFPKLAEIPQAQAHLQRNLSGDGPGTAKTAAQGGGTVLSLSERTKEIMTEKKIGFAQAQSEASKEFRQVFVNKGGR